MTEQFKQYETWNKIEDGYPENMKLYQVVYKDVSGTIYETKARLFRGAIFDDEPDYMQPGFYRKYQNCRPNPYDFLRRSDYEELDVLFWKEIH